MKTFINIVIATVLLFILGSLLLMGEKKSERVDCIAWQNQAKEFPGFYLLQWQKDQCDANGITINAPVK